MERLLSRSMRVLAFGALVAQLACAAPDKTEHVPRDAADCLELAKKERSIAEEYRRRSLRHRNGRSPSRLEHERLIRLAQEHDESAEQYERMAAELLSTQPPSQPDPINSSPSSGQ